MDHWVYEGLIGSGTTSYVFSGFLDGKPVAAKWMTKNDTQKEMANIRLVSKAKNPGESNLLLPISHFCGVWFLEDITESAFLDLRTLRGPTLIRDRKHKKHKLKGTGKDLLSCMLIFPLVDGDLEGENLRHHDVKQVEKDIGHALRLLHSHDPPIYHDDLALRNIFYHADEEGRQRYMLGDFGKIRLEEYDVTAELRKIISNF